MKKYALGLIVAAVFVAYSFVIRHQHSSLVIAPTTLSQNKTPSNSTNSNNYSSTNSGSSTSQTNQTAPVSYKDGTYRGSVANAYYGNVQVAAIISGGKLTTVRLLQSPNDNPNSQYINQQADPYLKQEAIQSQSANISLVTGATLTSQAFIESLTSALNQAKS